MKYSTSVPNRAKINKKWSKPPIDLNAKGPKKISLQDLNPVRGRLNVGKDANGQTFRFQYAISARRRFPNPDEQTQSNI